MKHERQILVKKDEENPEPIEVLAKAIIDVADAFEKLNSSPLKRNTLVLLLHHAIGVSKINKSHIEMVLDTAPKLKEIYLKPAKATTNGKK